jgi:hypothetical protein
MEPSEQASKKLLNLKALRERKQLDPKRLTGDNHPDNVFFIAGHGSETSDMKIVPEGCILVVQVHSGERNYFNGYEMFPYILNNEEIYKFLDPVTNYKDINNIIYSQRGYKTPFAIYREGDIYPDFYYSLLAYWDSEKVAGQKDSYVLENSGVIQYPTTHSLTPIRETIEKSSPGKDAFLNLYNASSLPFRIQLEQIIDTIPDPTIENIINFPQIQSAINISQSDLFSILGPGVYYNLVCRATRDSLLVKDPNTGIEILNNAQRALVDPSGHLRKNRPEILQQIGEAPYRANLIEKLNIKKGYNIGPRIINDIYLLEQENAPISKINALKVRHYLILKQHYLKLINDYKMMNWRTPEEREFMINKYEPKIKELDDLFAASAKSALLPENRSKKALLNPQHELNLQEQMSKQRAAHNNESNLVNTFAQVGLNAPRIPAQLAANNGKGFNQRRANAERQAAAAVAAWKKKGGKRTRRHKKYKNKSRKK